jgi:hypothetical protein
MGQHMVQGASHLRLGRLVQHEIEQPLAQPLLMQGLHSCAIQRGRTGRPRSTSAISADSHPLS